jgi:signal transduction histidine kinase
VIAALAARWERLDVLRRDALIAAVLGIVTFVSYLVDRSSTAAGEALAIALAGVAVVGLRRRWPIAMFAVSAVLAVAVAAWSGDGIFQLVLVVTAYTAVAYDDRARPMTIGVAAVLTAMASTAVTWRFPDVPADAVELVFTAAVAVLPVTLGRAVRTLRQRNAELDALRVQEAEQAVTDERMRIARELHDVVAHHVSAMTVRARAAHHVAGRDPQAAVDALDYVSTTGSAAMSAMRSMVGALRTAAGASEAPLSPQPTVDDLADLLRSYGDAGLAIEQRIDIPDPAALAPAVSLAAYRIVQEALTNVLRHADATTARVEVRQEGDQITVVVEDDGRGIDPSRRGGHGLSGMAERVALCDGTLSVVGGPTGGCRVTALLPA